LKQINFLVFFALHLNAKTHKFIRFNLVIPQELRSYTSTSKLLFSGGMAPYLYNYRTNILRTLKKKPLRFEDLQDFVA